ncbi:MAG TPA: helix-turn-helix domain-containing protein [Planctomycetota bacterium]|nr:helix-turn-helix domain-containing protein [Planctomycetota bacterium]
MGKDKPEAPTHTAVPLGPEEFPAFGALPAAGAEVARWLEAARVRPVSAFEWRCTEDWEQHPRRVPDAMWFCIASGTGWCRLTESEPASGARLGPGDIFIVPKAAEHHVRPDRGVAFRLFTVHFFAEAFGAADLLAALGLGGAFPGGARSPYVESSRRAARDFARRPPGWGQGMAAEIWRVLLHIVREHGDRLRPPGGGPLDRLRPVLELAAERLADPALSVGELAARAGVSEVHLRSLFRRGTGLAPMACIRRMRVERACLLLRTTEAPLKQVAADSGFADGPFFFRTFRRLTGRTPADYRRAAEV